jgi:hypothetical protein
MSSLTGITDHISMCSTIAFGNTFSDAIHTSSHSVHCALALWAMGADDEIIRTAYYKVDSTFQIPMFKSPEKITADNFNEHLGDDESVPLPVTCAWGADTPF